MTRDGSRILPLAGVLLGLALSAGCASRRGDPKAEVEAAMRAYDRLVLAMDAKGIAATYLPDGELVDPGKQTFRGQKAIRAHLASFDGAVRVEASQSTTESIEVTGDTAIQKGSYSQRARMVATGEVVDGRGRFTAEWVRQPDGSWRLRRMTAQ